MLCLCIDSAPAAEPQLPGVVRIDSGYIAGSGTAVRVFKGIPFAASTAGTQRWKPPQPVQPWSVVRMAKQFSPPCPQAATQIGTQRTSEDCLSINVWAPVHAGADKLPVLVWIYGGGFEIGASNVTAYDGERLAALGAVVVSFNYRLGIFGFLAHPELSQESARKTSGNYALLDMVEALRWIERNIAAFGGDPDNVTLWGESAGGTAVALLMVMPDAKGLFQKAILNSPWGLYNPASHLRETWYGRVPGEHLGQRLGDLAKLRGMSVEELLKVAGPLDLSGRREQLGEVYHQLVDGVVIPDDPSRLFDTGKFHDVPLIAGSIADEGTLFAVRPAPTTLGQVTDIVKSRISADPQRVLAAYALSKDAAPAAVLTKITGDSLFVVGTRALLRAAAARQHPAFQYEFTRVTGVGRRTGLLGFHGSDIPYFFATLPDSAFSGASVGPMAAQPSDFDGIDAELSRAMSGAIVRFAQTGDPNGPGLPPWPRFTTGSEAYLEYGDSIAVRTPSPQRTKQLDALSAAFMRQRERADKR